MPVFIPFLVAAAVGALVAGCSGGDKELPELPQLPDGDRTEDVEENDSDGEYVEQADGDPDADVHEQSDLDVHEQEDAVEDADVDNESVVEDGDTNEAVEDGDVEFDEETAVDGDSETTEIPTGDKYSCTLKAITNYNEVLATSMQSMSFVESSQIGWSGHFGFSNAGVEDAVCEDSDESVSCERQGLPSITWPDNGQDLPDYADNLVARWGLSLKTFGSEQLVVHGCSYSSEFSECDQTNASVYPMTWLNDDSSLAPIDSSLENEVRVVFDKPLTFSVVCDDVECTSFHGLFNISNMSLAVYPSYIKSVEVYCNKAE